MTETIEIVRFDVPPERADELIAGHERARLAIDSVSRGWVWSRLGRFDETSWVEIVAWRDRVAFDRALELSVYEPDAADWFALASPGWTIRLGEPLEAAMSGPPPEGTLRLAAASPGEDSALVAAPEEGDAWSMLIALDERAWREAEGDWRPESPELLRLTVSDGSRRQPPPCWTESAAIAHSYDASSVRAV
jgi:hypothetical protein